jgi:dihydrofolate reductase
MTAVAWHVVMSLDGFVAAPGDDMRWIFDVAGPSDTADEMVATTGAIVMGRRTYEVEDRDRPGIYAGAWNGPFFVLTHEAPATVPDWMTGTFVHDGVEDAVARAKTAAGERNVGLLGASIARQALDAGLLDEIVVQVAPVLLGDGVRMFDRPASKQIKLEKTGVAESGQLTDLRFGVLAGDCLRSAGGTAPAGVPRPRRRAGTGPPAHRRRACRARRRTGCPRRRRRR